MPSLRPCSVCGVLTRTNRCPTHTQGWTRYEPKARLGWEWTKIRNAYLQDHPRCAECGAAAVTVDHILARAFGGTHDQANLRSLCRKHARAKDARDSHEGRKRAQGGRVDT